MSVLIDDSAFLIGPLVEIVSLLLASRASLSTELLLKAESLNCHLGAVPLATVGGLPVPAKARKLAVRHQPSASNLHSNHLPACTIVSPM